MAQHIESGCNAKKWMPGIQAKHNMTGITWGHEDNECSVCSNISKNVLLLIVVVSIGINNSRSCIFMVEYRMQSFSWNLA
jgi:hypothetical protein